MGEAAKKSPLSVEDYLEGEKTAEVRHEYVDGEVFAMEGTTKAHNLISGNLYALLRTDLADRPRRIYMSDVKVHVKTQTWERFYYPDLHLEREPFTANSYYSDHPNLVVEILSETTERGDRSDKFFAYRKLPSLEEYVLVAQEEPRVEVYRRSTDWDLEVFTTEEIVELVSIGSETEVASVY